MRRASPPCTPIAACPCAVPRSWRSASPPTRRRAPPSAVCASPSRGWRRGRAGAGRRGGRRHRCQPRASLAGRQRGRAARRHRVRRDAVDRRPTCLAAGDCARWVNKLFGEEMRVEHWTNAAEQGRRGRATCWPSRPASRPSRTRPCRSSGATSSTAAIQFVGRAHGDDEVHVVAGDPMAVSVRRDVRHGTAGSRACSA